MKDTCTYIGGNRYNLILMNGTLDFLISNIIFLIICLVWVVPDLSLKVVLASVLQEQNNDTHKS